MEITVIHNIGNKVLIKGGTKEYEIIGYEYIPPQIKYIILDGDGNYKYCLPIELLKVESTHKIGFVYTKEQGNENQ